MGNKGTGRWAALLVASFVLHTALTVNSAETALWNDQGRSGAILAQQLADAAAPLTLSRDMVSLSVLVSRYENRPGISSVRLFNARRELIAEAGNPRDSGRLFAAPMRLQQQAAGLVELRLETPSRGLIVRRNLGNLGISALLHALIFTAGLLLSGDVQPARRQASPLAGTPQPHDTGATSAAPPTAYGTLLHIALDDPNNLLTRVSASMADEQLQLFDQLVDRTARLYGGEVSAPFSAEGVLLRFSQPDTVEREFQALAAAALFLRLVEESAVTRRQHGLLCLGAKAGVLHEQEDARVAAILAHTAPPGRILSSMPSGMLGSRCRLGSSFQLAVSHNETLQAALVEEFAPEYRQLINNQSQQILRPIEAD